METAGTRSISSPHASAVALPIAATRRGLPCARRRSSFAPVMLVRTSQSYGRRSTGSVSIGSSSSSGATTTSKPSDSSLAASPAERSAGRVTTTVSALLIG